MTGGAFGSLVAQWLRLSDAERTTLLVAGAAAGMSATFAAPIAAILIAVELLLFEWRPRSLVPVAVASVTAGALRIWWLGAGPLFPVDLPANIHLDQSLLIAVPLGILVGLAAAGLSRLMYGLEDAFEHLLWANAHSLDVVACNRRHRNRHWRILFSAWSRCGVRQHCGIAPGQCTRLTSAGSGDREVADVGLLAKFRNFRRSAGPIADDRRRHRRICCTPRASPRTDTGIVGASGDGCHACGRARRAAHSSTLLAGTHACAPRHPATFARLHCLLPCHLADHAAVDPHREAESPRLSSFARVRCRSARIGDSGRGDDRVPPGDEVKIGKHDHLPEAYVFSDETCRAVAEEMATTGLLNLLVVDRETNTLLGSVGAAELLAGRRRAVKRESERSVAFQFEVPGS